MIDDNFSIRSFNLAIAASCSSEKLHSVGFRALHLPVIAVRGLKTAKSARTLKNVTFIVQSLLRWLNLRLNASAVLLLYIVVLIFEQFADTQKLFVSN